MIHNPIAQVECKDRTNTTCQDQSRFLIGMTGESFQDDSLYDTPSFYIQILTTGDDHQKPKPSDVLQTESIVSEIGKPFFFRSEYGVVSMKSSKSYKLKNNASSWKMFLNDVGFNSSAISGLTVSDKDIYESSLSFETSYEAVELEAAMSNNYSNYTKWLKFDPISFDFE